MAGQRESREARHREMHVDSAIRGQRDTRANRDREMHVDRVIARQARYGVASRAALLSAGLSRDAIDRRVATGHLHPLHRGIYAVGHTAVPAQARRYAALLAC